MFALGLMVFHFVIRRRLSRETISSLFKRIHSLGIYLLRYKEMDFMCAPPFMHLSYKNSTRTGIVSQLENLQKFLRKYRGFSRLFGDKSV